MRTFTKRVDIVINEKILSKSIAKIRKSVNKYRAINESLKVVILDPLEIASSRKEDKVFSNGVKKGIILWEGQYTFKRGRTNGFNPDS